MSAQQQSLTDWVKQLNHAIFYQPNDEVAINTINEQVDPSLIVKINHSVYSYEQFKAGIQYTRGSGVMTLDSVSEILQWDDTEKRGGAVAHITKFTSKAKMTGNESKKTSVIISTVKWIGGQRKLTELTEVEVE
ncbi:hypothetical protein OIDMADRAFT_32916 [Oidiodendron maius Zn]|uniref:Uncharacterized protein n=1 Tax=Oidiodendron maius (strain Zn) TaxID=913774 RepID=A0A0C3CDM4_OIDMZ|nr:hypothetical protein OIDMADRAFT_32916 [Oidiodendron maius Zn]